MRHNIAFCRIVLTIFLLNFPSAYGTLHYGKLLQICERLQKSPKSRSKHSPDATKIAFCHTFTPCICIQSSNGEMPIILYSTEDDFTGADSIIWSPCSTRLISLNDGDAGRIWDIETGQCLKKIKFNDCLFNEARWNNYGVQFINYFVTYFVSVEMDQIKFFQKKTDEILFSFVEPAKWLVCYEFKKDKETRKIVKNYEICNPDFKLFYNNNN